MAVTKTNASNNTSELRVHKYSAFIGRMYESNPANDQAMAEAVALAGGDDVRKAGFRGTGKDTPSGIALAYLVEKEVTAWKYVVSGVLSNVKLTERTQDNRRTIYLGLSLVDESGTDFISLDITSEAAQNLLMKLAKAEPGVHTSVSMFGTYQAPAEGQRSFAHHAASLKQGEDQVEVKAISWNDVVQPVIDQKLAPVKDEMDKESLNGYRTNVKNGIFLNIAKQIAATFEAYRASKQQQGAGDSEDAQSEQRHEGGQADAVPAEGSLEGTDTGTNG